MDTTTQARQATFTAIVSSGENDGGNATLVVFRFAPGAVSGPASDEIDVDGMALPQIELLLAAQRFALVGAWRVATAFDGVRLQAEVVRLALPALPASARYRPVVR